MEIYPEQFPEDRRAEYSVFDAIQDSDRPGSANHEWQPDPETPQVDFTLWLPGVGRFHLEIKGVR